MKRTAPLEARHEGKLPPSPLVKTTGFIVGYARVSTEEQILDLQVNALTEAGCTRIFTEKVSGVGKKRPQLDLAMKDLQPGDTFAVWRVDRLGRNTEEVLARIRDIKATGAIFRSLTEGFDFNTPIGEFSLTVLIAWAAMERSGIVERTVAGMKAARLRGSQIGAPIKFTDAKKAKARTWIKAGAKPAVVAKRLDLSAGTISTWVKKGMP